MSAEADAAVVRPADDGGEVPVPVEHPAAEQAPDRWHLEDEREFLVRSLADADAELEAGDLTSEDHQLLVGRDRRRLEVVEAELASLGVADPGNQAAGAPAAPRRRFKRRGWMAVGGVVALAAAAVLLVVSLTTSRLPGQPSSGSVDVNAQQKIDQQLAQATTLVAEGDVGGAIALYGSVLGEDPNQPEALAEWGWLSYQVGVKAGNAALIRDARGVVARSVEADPSAPAGHLFDGIIVLQQDHDAVRAVDQFAQFLADHPTAAQIQSSAPYLRQAYAQADEPLPSQVAAAG